MKLAFVFPGQGSQQVGMMKNFTDLAEVPATFAEASAALGDDLWALAEQGPAEALNLTRNTQPVMLTRTSRCAACGVRQAGRCLPSSPVPASAVRRWSLGALARRCRSAGAPRGGHAGRSSAGCRRYGCRAATTRAAAKPARGPRRAASSRWGFNAPRQWRCRHKEAVERAIVAAGRRQARCCRCHTFTARC
jgi:hypothetical protein